MDSPELIILGCGSALPTTKHNLSSQVVSLRNKLYMIDCGEGTQLEFRRIKLNFNRLGHIFLSHLHGDHCFGIPGFISTLGLLGRTADLHIHAQPDAEKLFRPILDYFCKELPYKVIFRPFNPGQNLLIHEDKSMEVYTIPLKHRVPTAGFLFVEKAKPRHIVREACNFYGVPVYRMNAIKAGADFITPDGEVIPNERLTRAPEPPTKYAYCSDTAYDESIIPIIKGADLLYHEATFTGKDIARAKETFHSSAAQAAQIACAAKVKKLLLGHFSARYPNEQILLTEAQAIFPNTALADEGMKVGIG
jgi:ribonuclease Z